MTSSQNFDYYVPVYDTVPDTWEDAHPFLVEQLKRISNSLNARSTGWMVESEVLSGKRFATDAAVGSKESVSYNDVLRKVVKFGAVAAGANTAAHSIDFSADFRLVMLYVSATDFGTPLAETFVGTEVTMDGTNINFNSPQAFASADAVIEYYYDPS